MRSLIIIILSMLSINIVCAQDKVDKAVVSSGAVKAENNEVQLQGTIGQRFIGKASNNENNIGIGFWESIIAKMSTSIIEVDPTILPVDFQLGQNYPNPADQETRIEIQIPDRLEIQLVLFGIDGKRLGVIHKGPLSIGKFIFATEVSHLPQGQYRYALLVNNIIVDSRPLSVIHR